MCRMVENSKAALKNSQDSIKNRRKTTATVCICQPTGSSVDQVREGRSSKRAAPCDPISAIRSDPLVPCLLLSLTTIDQRSRDLLDGLADLAVGVVVEGVDRHDVHVAHADQLLAELAHVFFAGRVPEHGLHREAEHRVVVGTMLEHFAREPGL